MSCLLVTIAPSPFRPLPPPLSAPFSLVLLVPIIARNVVVSLASSVGKTTSKRTYHRSTQHHTIGNPPLATRVRTSVAPTEPRRCCPIGCPNMPSCPNSEPTRTRKAHHRCSTWTSAHGLNQVGIVVYVWGDLVMSSGSDGYPPPRTNMEFCVNLYAVDGRGVFDSLDLCFGARGSRNSDTKNTQTHKHDRAGASEQ